MLTCIEFKEQCKSNNSPSCKYGMVYKMFTEELNIHPFIPNNDQCNESVTFENFTPEEKIEQRIHIKGSGTSQEKIR